MKLRKDLKKLILFILKIFIIICILNLRLTIYIFAHIFLSPTNDKVADREIKQIVSSYELTHIEYQYTTKMRNGTYNIVFYSKGLSASEESDMMLKETVDIYYSILNSIKKSSKLYNSRISLEVSESPSLPLCIELYNYQYNMVSVNAQIGDISFYDLVSVKIDCPITNLKPLEGSKDEILFLWLGANCETDNVNLSDFDKAIKNVTEGLS